MAMAAVKLTVKVSGMTCGGCAAAIKRAVEGAAPGAAVSVSLERGEVEIVGGDAATARAAIAAAGFGVSD
jgi:copper chaperone